MNVLWISSQLSLTHFLIPITASVMAAIVNKVPRIPIATITV